MCHASLKSAEQYELLKRGIVDLTAQDTALLLKNIHIPQAFRRARQPVGELGPTTL
jgi:hypothetical protein